MCTKHRLIRPLCTQPTAKHHVICPRLYSLSPTNSVESSNSTKHHSLSLVLPFISRFLLFIETAERGDTSTISSTLTLSFSPEPVGLFDRERERNLTIIGRPLSPVYILDLTSFLPVIIITHTTRWLQRVSRISRRSRRLRWKIR
jgi:hypothetical protein